MTRAESLMRKYRYGYKHACDLLNEPFVKDLESEIKRLQKIVDEYGKAEIEREEQERLDWLIKEEEVFNEYNDYDEINEDLLWDYD